MNALKNISRIQIRQETLILLLNLYESKGKTFYYNELFKRDHEAFMARTLERDVVEVAKLFNLNLTDARIKLCAKKKISPSTKDEQLLINIKKIIYRIQTGYKKFELLANEAEELSKTLTYKHSNVNWTRKTVNEQEGLLATKKKYSAREDLEKLIELYYNILKEKKYERTTIITNFYVDFINMEIFDNFNDKVALFLLYALLFQMFPIFQYVSFFKHYNSLIEPIKFALDQANYNWASKFSQTDNLNEIIYQILMRSYEEIDSFAYEYEFEKDLNKTDSVENTILKFNRQFSKEDLRRAHPNISDATINLTLQRLREEKKIMALGTGRSAKWQVIIDNRNYRQLSIFGEEE